MGRFERRDGNLNGNEGVFLVELSEEEKRELVELLEWRHWRTEHRKLYKYYPMEGDLSFDKYPKHMAFFAAGKKFKERAVLGGNRIGKTEGIGLYELTCHLTGRYPKWWKGRTFYHPVKCWVAGTTSQTVRDILQYKLLGPIDDVGSGLIPYDHIRDLKRRAGNTPDTIETVRVEHFNETGRYVGLSRLTFKSYEQGRKSFEGDTQDIIDLDEECPLDIYTECLTRTMTTNGMVMLQFTPLQGLSETVLQFLPGGVIPSEMGKRYVTQIGWDDAPHLTTEQKQELIDSYPVHERAARSKGIPQIGSGRIYPVDEEDLMIDDFEVPEHFPMAFALDVGWNATAALWGAWDREQDILYIVGEYFRGQAEPAVHAEAIRSRGDIPGVCDPAALGRGQKDGSQLMKIYEDYGLNLSKAKNFVESGIFGCYKRMTSGRLKVFRSCSKWFEEFRIYRRDKDGKVVKENDHVRDCMRDLEN